jgi:hypothetical protein
MTDRWCVDVRGVLIRQKSVLRARFDYVIRFHDLPSADLALYFPFGKGRLFRRGSSPRYVLTDVERLFTLRVYIYECMGYLDLYKYSSKSAYNCIVYWRRFSSWSYQVVDSFPYRLVHRTMLILILCKLGLWEEAVRVRTCAHRSWGRQTSVIWFV